MDELASQLNACAGGLQQSFGVVFERVGESLSQSVQMMQRMNKMMESALLSSIIISCTIPPNAINRTNTMAPWIVRISNQSQLHITNITINIIVNANSSHAMKFTTNCELIEATTTYEYEFILDMNNKMSLPLTIHITFPSPGTKVLLEKSKEFHISVFDTLKFNSETIKLESLSFKAVTSYDVNLEKLRHILQLNPFEGICSASNGCYSFIYPPNSINIDAGKVFYISIHRSTIDRNEQTFVCITPKEVQNIDIANELMQALVSITKN